MIGRTLSHYRIVSRVGAGGMGEVYRAEDTRLGRSVAVKVLVSAISGDEAAAARFEREARAIAALSHPNVLTVFDFGRDGDVWFTVTELLDGETLRQVIAREAPVPVSRAVDIARHMAAGLAATHDHGIVHRDLKPENVFTTTDGGLKLLDFGLAKASPLGDTAGQNTTVTNATAPGTILGSPAYMAPEQIRGQDAVPATDVFAFGITLYELLTGLHPFRQPTPGETLSAILRDEPADLASVRADVPPALAALVRACLSKRVADRPASAARLVADIGALSLGSGPPETASRIDSLAVLPFTNQSGDPDVDYLSDGLTDTLIDNLCQLPRLRVMARSSVFQLDGSTDPRAAGDKLNVRAVLTGRLLLRRDELVVRTELVRARDGTRIWGGRFNRPASDLLAIEEEIAREISDNLRVELDSDDRARLAKRPTQNADAHHAYLQGRHVWSKWKTPDGMKMAIEFFERAIELDPLFARAYAGLADSYSMLGNIKAVPPEKAYPNAKTAALQGLAIDPDVAELHSSLAIVHRFWDWDWPAADAAFARAVTLNPGYATGHRFRAHYLAGLGRFEEALASAYRALELDPLSLIIHTAVGDVLFYARRYEDAMTYYEKTIHMDPEFLPGHTDLARAYELAGRYEDAIREFETAAALAPKGPPEPSSGLAHVYAQMGDVDRARGIVEQLVDMRRRRYVSPYGIASIFACMGEVDAAFDWLETAFQEHDQTLVWMNVHPRLDRLRDDERFRNLRARLRFE